jgi:uncharacterized protein YbaP (TraB family)
MRRLLLGVAGALALAVPAGAEPPVWVVRDADSELLIFGSIHVLPPGLDWRPAALDAALRRAEDLWFEIPLGAEAERDTARLAAELGVLAPDGSLFRLLAPADAARLARVAQDYGVDRAALDRLEPWLAEIALAGAAYRKAGADAAFGVEQVLNGAATPTAPRRALETAAEQLGIFDQAPMDDQLASLNQTVVELDRNPEAYIALVRAWLAGDVAGLQREAVEPLRQASPRLFQRLVTERNARWTRTLDARLKGRGRTVVVVGVGHLVGEDGLPQRLRALGYSVAGP